MKIPFASKTCLISIVILAAHTLQPHVFSQGCVIARGGGSTMASQGGFLEANQWQLAFNYRWFESDRHFGGTEEHEYRQEQNTEVINDSHYLDTTMTYAVSRRLWLNFTVPMAYIERSSLYEHKGNSSGERYSTQAGGLGDVRLTANYWLVDPEVYHAGNFSLGFGFKAPTGDYKATDTFMRPGGPQTRYVDSSIQPGDGGWGVILELQGFHSINERTAAYVNGAYTVNPREQVPETGFSVPDNYLLRAGLDFAAWPEKGIVLSLGGRIEGVPPEDLSGGSNGRRRPGYSVSIEPGISFARGNYAFAISAPIAIQRNRQQSIPEIPRGRHGDAAFTDYTINTSFVYRF